MRLKVFTMVPGEQPGTYCKGSPVESLPAAIFQVAASGSADPRDFQTPSGRNPVWFAGIPVQEGVEGEIRLFLIILDPAEMPDASMSLAEGNLVSFDEMGLKVQAFGPGVITG